MVGRGFKLDEDDWFDGMMAAVRPGHAPSLWIGLKGEEEPADVRIGLHPKQWATFNSRATEILFGGSAGPGKAVHVSTPLPTPAGWTTMGDVRVGDELLGAHGDVVKVLAKSRAEVRPVYRITFHDGATIVADDEHEWWVFDNADRAALTRRNPEWRAARRERRPSRAKTSGGSPGDRNKKHPSKALPPPTGKVITTKEMARKFLKNGRRNYSVQVARSLQLPERDFEIDPYTLGAWLGDGDSNSASITCSEDAILAGIQRGGYAIRKRKTKGRYGISLLQKQLRKEGVLNNKHIPARYLRGSELQRLSLLQGLMDTDGCCSPKDGSCEFSTTRIELAEGIVELLATLGIRAQYRSGRAKLYGKDCGPKYRVIFTTLLKVFTVERKGCNQPTKVRNTQRWRMITNVERIEPCKVQCVQVEGGLYLAGRQFIPTHNSLLLRASAIFWCHELQGLQWYLFRRTYPDLVKNHMEGAGSFPELLAPWMDMGYVKINHSLGWISIGRSKIHLCHCQHEKDVYNYQGAEIHVLTMDELTQFTMSQYRFLRSRVRLGGFDMHKHPRKAEFPRIINATNPGGLGHHWVRAGWIDPKPPMEIWSTPKEEGGMDRQFIPALLTDNPTMSENDPEYSSRLEGLGDPMLVRAMLEGRWDIVAGGYFDDCWNEFEHVLQPFDIPESWMIDRSFDWGSARPFSVGWWAESDGTPAIINGVERHFCKGSIFRINEWYGCVEGKPDVGLRLSARDIAKGILEREEKMGFRNRVKAGPADSQIWVDEDTHCIEREFRKAGVRWIKCEKYPGSVVHGCNIMRQLMRAAVENHTEFPCMFVFDRCRDFIRTIASLPRSQRNPEEIDKGAEDHAIDDARYRSQRVRLPTARSGMAPRPGVEKMLGSMARGWA